MLVDLGRNDVGRVAAPGSVRVEDLMVIERYSHVMHIVSQVRGQAGARGTTRWTRWRARFPAGTVSGAPEDSGDADHRRAGAACGAGPTRGAVGYLSFCGTLDVAIALRTFFVDGDRTLWTGGRGLVADSVPAKEYGRDGGQGARLGAALKLAREGGGR